MDIPPFHSSVIIIMTAGFFLATLLGMITQKAKLSTVPGYLIAGYLIGPYSPGLVADVHIAEQLAEIGVILMMFNVGLHIDLKELLNVKKVAIPGAFFQSLASATLGLLLITYLGGSLESGIIFGIAISVASTMILVKLLTDHKLINTEKGHITLGWLIVEDIITVLFLILIPVLSIMHSNGEVMFLDTAKSILMALLYFMLLVAFMMTIGKKYVEWVLKFIIKIKSTELLTLAVLSLTFQIAIGSAYFFGMSIALGAFIAGVVIGQMPNQEQIGKNGEGIKDIFVILFFLAIGMLFNPSALFSNMTLFLSTLVIVLVVKPIAAFIVVYLLKYPVKTAVLVGIGLAQIGEFSFIVAEEANRVKLLPDDAYDIIVATALISIALNPLLFRWYDNWAAKARR